jgi:L-fuculose-phosphate aldolase
MTQSRESQLREQLCFIGAQMHRFQLVDGASGNISARLDSERILITPSGVSKGFMKPENLIIIDLEGRQLDDNPRQPSTETPMHLEAFRKRPDVGGVIHAHPPHAVALTVAGLSLHTYTLPEVVLLLGEVPITPYATPSSTENRDAISEIIESNNALLLAYHGSLTVGADPWEAYLRLENLEYAAKLTHLIRQLGGGAPLPPHQLEKLVAMRSGYKLAGYQG